LVLPVLDLPVLLAGVGVGVDVDVGGVAFNPVRFALAQG
jgi:hypothetical protein